MQNIKRGWGGERQEERNCSKFNKRDLLSQFMAHLFLNT